ncbi:MAG: CoA transferase [Clostridiales bacterium]|nr:CoA transferase [Clostridiales bacterium]
MNNGFNKYTVVDFTTENYGMIAAEYLAMNDFNVIRVEAPRDKAKFKKKEKVAHITYNLNKKCITLNIETEQGKKVFKKLLKKADVLVEDLPYGAMAKLGFGYDQVKEMNPAIVYTSIKPYPEGAPWQDVPATITTVTAMSGVTYLNGYKGYIPMTPGPDLGNTSTAAYAMLGVIACLYRREIDGEGHLVEINQQEALIAHSRSAYGNLYTHGINRRSGNAPATLVSAWPMDMFPSKGEAGKENYVFLGCKDEGMWRKLAEAIDRPELKEDPRFSTWQARKANIKELSAIITEYTMQYDKFELMDKLMKQNRVICSAVQSLEDLMNSDELRDNAIVQKIEDNELGEMWLPAWPFVSSVNRVNAVAPVVADATVIKDLGLTEDELVVAQS